MLSVLFVGSLNPGSAAYSTQKYEEFLDFCRQLGGAASGRVNILICGSTPRTADYSIAEGAFKHFDSLGTKAPEVVQIRLYNTDDDENQRAKSDIYLRFLDPKEKFSKIEGPFPHAMVAYQKAVDDCDIVTLIGGDKNTALIGEIAIQRKKPVLGFSAFAGAAQKFNQELKRVYQLIGIDREKTEILHARKMTFQHSALYLDLMSHVHKANLWSARSAWRRGACLVGLLLVLSLIFVASIVSAGYGLLEYKGMKYIALYLSCIVAGLAGGYASFLTQLNTPGDILLAKSVPASGQGIVLGLGFATFGLTILNFVLTDQEKISHLSFERFMFVFSVMSFVVAAFGLRGLKKLEEVLANRPGLN